MSTVRWCATGRSERRRRRFDRCSGSESGRRSSSWPKIRRRPGRCRRRWGNHRVPSPVRTAPSRAAESRMSTLIEPRNGSGMLAPFRGSKTRSDVERYRRGSNLGEDPVPVVLDADDASTSPLWRGRGPPRRRRRSRTPDPGRRAGRVSAAPLAPPCSQIATSGRHRSSSPPPPGGGDRSCSQIRTGFSAPSSKNSIFDL